MEGNSNTQEIPWVGIAPNGDLVIELQKSEQIQPSPATGPKVKQSLVAKFSVDRSTLINLSMADQTKSSFFKVLLTGSFREAAQDHIAITDLEIDPLHLFLSIVHDREIENTLDVSHQLIWPLEAIRDQYNVSREKFETWFVKWYTEKGDAIDEISPREMLYPCWRFNHAPGFLEASRCCIYGVKGHIEEKNPTTHRGLHLPPRIIRKVASNFTTHNVLIDFNRAAQRSSWSVTNPAHPQALHSDQRSFERVMRVQAGHSARL
jgi:hypothetical protein